MATKDNEYNIEEQRERAKRLFGSFCGLLVAFVFGFVVFQFGLFGVKLGDEATQLLIWTFASFTGVSAYLITNITYFYRRIDAKDIAKRADFKLHTFWYVSTLLRAPILAIVVLWILTNLDISIASEAANGAATGTDVGAGISFRGLPDLVLTGLAFIMGYYSRVTLKQLDIITKAIFPRAWALAEYGFEIVAPKELLLKEQHTFTTEPLADVVWSTSDGTIDAKSGAYTAPDDLKKAGQEAKVIAALRSEPSATTYKGVKLLLFKIVSDKDTVKASEKDVKLSLETKVEGVKLENATWTCTGVTLKPNKGKEVKFDAPATEGEVKAEAKLKHSGTDYTASLTIKVEKSNSK